MTHLPVDILAARRKRGVFVRMPLVAVVVFAIVAVFVGVAQSGDSASAARSDTFFGNATPGTVTDADRLSVTLGVQFSSKVDGTVTAVRFYKGPRNTGTHRATLWSGSGKKLANVTVTGETRTGWQTATFATPVVIKKGKRYVASYLAPRGRYSVDEGGFDRAVTSGALTIPPGGGVYTYGDGGFPRHNYRNSNYYVDVVFSADSPSPTPGDTPTPTPRPRLRRPHRRQHPLSHRPSRRRPPVTRVRAFSTFPESRGREARPIGASSASPRPPAGPIRRSSPSSRPSTASATTRRWRMTNPLDSTRTPACGRAPRTHCSKTTGCTG